MFHHFVCKEDEIPNSGSGSFNSAFIGVAFDWLDIQDSAMRLFMSFA
jgi:hypothetical protein